MDICMICKETVKKIINFDYLSNQIDGSFNCLLFIFWSCCIVWRNVCLYMAVHSPYSAMLFSSPAASSWPLPALTWFLTFQCLTWHCRPLGLLSAYLLWSAGCSVSASFNSVLLIHFLGLTLCTVRPWIYELQVTVIVLPLYQLDYSVLVSNVFCEDARLA